MLSSKKEFQSNLISQETPRDFFTITPNIVSEMRKQGLISKSDEALYNAYRRIAGEHGACWVGTRGLEYESGLDAKTITKSKKNLSRSFKILGGKSLIQITPCDRKMEHADTVIIIDIWPENHRYFKEKYTCGKKHHTGVGKNPTQEEPYKQEEQQAAKGAIAPAAASFRSLAESKAKQPPKPPYQTKCTEKPKSCPPKPPKPPPDPEVVSLLNTTALAQKTKEWALEKFDGNSIRKALTICQEREGEIKKSLDQYFKTVIQERWWEEQSKSLGGTRLENNKAYAMKYHCQCNEGAEISCWDDYVCIARLRSAGGDISIEYSDKKFMEKFKAELVKWEFESLEE